jgi:polyisoprenyl-phosphate glycosyltransferase
MLAPDVSSSPALRIVVVCPVYDDAQPFEQIRQRVRTTLREHLGISDCRFVITDDTAGEDLALHALADAHTDVLTPPYNLGHQGAIVFALRELVEWLRPEDVIVTMDSDGEDRPEDLPLLLAPLFDSPDDLHLVSVARRTHRKEGVAFRMAYLAFKLLFRVLTGTVIRSGNFAAMRGALVVAAIGHPHFDQCYSSTLIALPFRRRDVPLARGTRYSGRSRMNAFRLVTHGMHMLMPFLERIAVRCLIVGMGGLALGLAGAGLVAGQAAGWMDLPVFAAPMVFALVMASVIGLLTALTLFATAARSRAQSVRVLHAETPIGSRHASGGLSSPPR